MDGRKTGDTLLDRRVRSASSTVEAHDGDRRDQSGNGRGSDFAPLLREIRAAGLLAPRRGAYLRAVLIDLALLTLVGAAIVLVAPSWWVLLLAVPLTVVTVRFTFLGHDACHQQVAVTRARNRWIGLLAGNLLCGMSMGWWNAKHNRHHAHPNHTGKDPDVDVGALVWTQWQATERQGLSRWLTRNQARLFVPMLLLEGIALKVTSVRELRNRPPRDRAVEAVLLALHVLTYVGLLLAVLPPVKALVFALVHQALLGLYLGGVFAPNHKGMEMPGDEDRWGHLKRQVVTARNVRGGPVRDWLLGGLNLQIEHHLFPSMPRQNLRRARPLVRRYCGEVGLPYTETGLVASHREGLRHMHAVGEPLRAERRRVRAS